MYRSRPVLQVCIAANLFLNVHTFSIAAQNVSSSSAFLPPDHWSISTVRRFSTLGLTDPSFGWGDGSLTRQAVARTLRNAIAIAREKHPELTALTQGYWLRFTQEFPVTAAQLQASRTPLTNLGEGWGAIGYSSATGRLYPVRSVDRTRENFTGPFPRPNLSTIDLGANLSFTAGPHLAASITPQRSDNDWSLSEAYLLASWKKLGIWAGRRAPAFQTGTGGGIVLNGTASFTGGGITFIEPVRLPWVLRYIGPIRFETFLSQIDSNAAVRHPWFLAAHASISPHPRILLGATQAFMFSGSGLPPFTWRNFIEMFRSHGIVAAGSEFENGIASGEIRVRPPVPLIPLSLYLEWGADDNHRAWVLFPGRVIGGQIPAIPGLPALSLGLEHAYFSKPCSSCGDCHCEYYATWYRHYLFKDGWTLDRQPIGHPLGGDGYEWLLYGTWDDPANPLRLDTRAFLRYRGPYNIYSPAHGGKSSGGSLSAVYRATPNLDVLFTGAFENGRTGWHESAISTGFRWLF